MTEEGAAAARPRRARRRQDGAHRVGVQGAPGGLRRARAAGSAGDDRGRGGRRGRRARRQARHEGRRIGDPAQDGGRARRPRRRRRRGGRRHLPTPAGARRRRCSRACWSSDGEPATASSSWASSGTPAYGPVIAFGLGGVLTEVRRRRRASRWRRSTSAEARALPDQIRARRLLDEFRGAPAVDRAALAGVLRALSRIAADLPEVAEIDVNPLLIDGDTPVAVDALVLLLDGAAGLRLRSAPSCPISGRCSRRPPWPSSALPTTWPSGAARHSETSWTAATPGGSTPSIPAPTSCSGSRPTRSVEELPEKPDLVLVVVGGSLVPEVLESCVRAQARAVVVITAGFAETGAGGSGRRTRPRPPRPRGRHDPHRAQLHRPHVKRAGVVRDRLRRHAPAAGQPEPHLAVGQHGPDRRQHLRAARRRPGQVPQRRQRSRRQRLRCAGLPPRGPRHQVRDAVPGGSDRRQAFLRRRPPHHSREAGRRAARRPYRGRRTRRRLAHRRPGRLRRRLRGRRAPGRRRHLYHAGRARRLVGLPRLPAAAAGSPCRRRDQRRWARRAGGGRGRRQRA